MIRDLLGRIVAWVAVRRAEWIEIGREHACLFRLERGKFRLGLVKHFLNSRVRSWHKNLVGMRNILGRVSQIVKTTVDKIRKSMIIRVNCAYCCAETAKACQGVP